MNQSTVEKIREYLKKREHTLDADLIEIFEEVMGRKPKQPHLLPIKTTQGVWKATWYDDDPKLHSSNKIVPIQIDPQDTSYKEP